MMISFIGGGEHFKNEFQRKMEENEILGMNSLLRNILIML
jgi:hypothetical protein